MPPQMGPTWQISVCFGCTAIRFRESEEQSRVESYRFSAVPPNPRRRDFRNRRRRSHYLTQCWGHASNRPGCARCRQTSATTNADHHRSSRPACSAINGRWPRRTDIESALSGRGTSSKLPCTRSEVALVISRHTRRQERQTRHEIVNCARHMRLRHTISRCRPGT